MADPAQPANPPVVPPARPAEIIPVPLDKQDEYAEIIRSISRHEDTLINNRFTWFATLQGLLFAALAFIWKESGFTACCLVFVICWLGFAVAHSTGTTIKQADGAHNKLRDWWQARLAGYRGPGRTGSEMNNADLWDMAAKTPWYHVPRTFKGAWIVIFALFTYDKLQAILHPKAESPTTVTIQAAQAIISIRQPGQLTPPTAPTAVADTTRARRPIPSPPLPAAATAPAASPPKEVSKTQSTPAL